MNQRGRKERRRRCCTSLLYASQPPGPVVLDTAFACDRCVGSNLYSRRPRLRGVNLSHLGAPIGPMIRVHGGFANRMYASQELLPSLCVGNRETPAPEPVPLIGLLSIRVPRRWTFSGPAALL